MVIDELGTEINNRKLDREKMVVDEMDHMYRKQNQIFTKNK